MSNYDLFKQADALWEKGQAKAAFAIFLQLAKKGDSSAQLNVGYFYDEGEGIRRNRGRALYWYKLAWKTERQTSACCNIAQVYAAIGNTRQAVYWWRKAIASGDGDAALDFAKHLMLLNRQKSRLNVIAGLLERAIKSSHVSPAGVEEAERLMDAMKREKNRKGPGSR